MTDEIRAQRRRELIERLHAAELRAEIYRALVMLWVARCDCSGPQPSPDDPKTEQHAFDCDYVRHVFAGIVENNDAT